MGPRLRELASAARGSRVSQPGPTCALCTLHIGYMVHGFVQPKKTIYAIDLISDDHILSIYAVYMYTVYGVH